MGAQLRLDLRPRRAGAETGEPGLVIDAQQPVHPLQRDVDHRAVDGRHRQVADDAGAAAIGHHERAEPAGGRQRLCGLVVTRRQGDTVGAGADAPRTQRNPVGKALSAGVQHAQPCFRLEWRTGRQTAGRQGLEYLLQHRVARGGAGTDAILQEGTGVVAQCIVVAVFPPTVPASHACSGHRTGRSISAGPARTAPITAANSGRARRTGFRLLQNAPQRTDRDPLGARQLAAQDAGRRSGLAEAGHHQ